MTTKTKTKKARKLTKKQIDKLVERCYYDTCSGIQINIMDISKVFAAGRAAYAEGVTDPDELGARVRAFVETIRKN